MHFPEFLGRESYDAKCYYCQEELKVERKEVEAGSYECPKCLSNNVISEATKALYSKRRIHEAKHKKLLIEKQELRESKRLKRIELQKKRDLELKALRQAEVRKQQSLLEERKRRLQSGLCPKCGATGTELVKKGYNTGTGIACCLLAGPLGLLGGMAGSGNTLCICKACGFQYEPGKL